MASAGYRDGKRVRKTISGATFCDVLRRFSEAHPYVSRPRPQRYEYMDAARAIATHTNSEWYAYVRSLGCRCEYCGEYAGPGFWAKDHRTPVSRGGSDGMDNLALACFWCNQYKLDRTEDEFRSDLVHMKSLRRQIADANARSRDRKRRGIPARR